MRREIMKLRDDPVASSAMAGVLTQSNSFQLTGKIGRRPTDSELYMAHFMGVGGAAKLINSADDNPQASAARMFPNAAAANRSIFYDRHGQGAQRLRGLCRAVDALCRRGQRAGHADGARDVWRAARASDRGCKRRASRRRGAGGARDGQRDASCRPSRMCAAPRRR